jgi:hypothetical protein
MPKEGGAGQPAGTIIPQRSPGEPSGGTVDRPRAVLDQPPRSTVTPAPWAVGLATLANPFAAGLTTGANALLGAGVGWVLPGVSAKTRAKYGAIFGLCMHGLNAVFAAHLASRAQAEPSPEGRRVRSDV